MKNVLTILLASFILISGMKLSIVQHICGGELADVKFSISEAPASCGMETNQTACGAHEKSTSDCCRNKITKLGVDDYFGASSQQINEVFQPVVVLFFLPLIQSVFSSEIDIQAFTDVGYIANITPKEVSLPKICVFRI